MDHRPFHWRPLPRPTTRVRQSTASRTFRILRRLRMTFSLCRARDVRNSLPGLGEVDLPRANNRVATDRGSVATDDRSLCFLVSELSGLSYWRTGWLNSRVTDSAAGSKPAC